MNAILKDLCEQAKVYATTATKDFTGDEPIGFMDFHTEKFADLIIDKCVRACVEDIADPRDTIELQCAQKIKLTFGIK